MSSACEEPLSEVPEVEPAEFRLGNETVHHNGDEVNGGTSRSIRSSDDSHGGVGHPDRLVFDRCCRAISLAEGEPGCETSVTSGFDIGRSSSRVKSTRASLKTS